MVTTSPSLQYVLHIPPFSFGVFKQTPLVQKKWPDGPTWQHSRLMTSPQHRMHLFSQTHRQIDSSCASLTIKRRRRVKPVLISDLPLSGYNRLELIPVLSRTASVAPICKRHNRALLGAHHQPSGLSFFRCHERLVIRTSPYLKRCSNDDRFFSGMSVRHGECQKN